MPFPSRSSWSAVCVAAAVAFLGCEEPIPDQLSTGLDFVEGAPSFENYADDLSGWQLQTEQAVELFGAEAVCVPGSSPCRPTDVAQEWMNDVNETLTHGHSEGIALLTLAFQLGVRTPSDFGADTVAGLSLSNQALVREVARWSATQKIPSALSRDRAFQAKDVMRFLTQAFKPGQNEAWRLAVAMKDGVSLRGGHALVPFGFFKGPLDGQFYLRVYDSNWPGQERRLLIDTKANTWSYEGSANAEAPRTYAGSGDDGNLLYFSPVTAHQGPFEAPFASGARSLLVAAEGTLVTLRDATGSEVGLKADGTLTENGGAVRPAFAQSRCVLCPGPAEVVNYTLSPDGGMGGAQSISISNFGNTSLDGGTVNVSAPGVSVKLSGVRTEKGDALVEVEGSRVTYSSTESGTPTSITVTTAGADGGTTTVTVQLKSAPRGGISIDTSDPSNVKVTATSSGDAVTGSVTVTTTSSTGTSSTQSSQLDVKPGKPTTVNAQPGMSLAVDPPPNSACDNGSYDPKRPNGVLDGTESDVDCGGVCPKCGTGKFCRFYQNDCASGVCVGTSLCRPGTPPGSADCNWGMCQAPTCFDKVMNGEEFDVDCGRSCIGTCAVGRRCTQDAQCAGTVSGTPVCLATADGGTSSCQIRRRRSLEVTHESADFEVNLNGTVIDGKTFATWKVKPATFFGRFSVPFDAALYHFKLGTELPAQFQHNFACALTNPTNDPALLALGGYGDGGVPSLTCTRIATSVVVEGTGCAGMSIPYSTNFNGQVTERELPLTGSGAVGSGSMDLGRMRTFVSVNVPQSFRSATINGVARTQSCRLSEPLNYLMPSFGAVNAGLFARITCECRDDAVQGPTRSGNPCDNAEVVPAIAIGSERTISGNTRMGNNDFVFPADAGCSGNREIAKSGNDKAFRITVPANADLLVDLVDSSPVRTRHFDTSIIASRAQCGTNGSTAATTGTVGASCVSTNYFGANYFENPSASPQDVYFVVDGAGIGDQGDFTYKLTIVPHATTVSGNPCASATLTPNNGTQTGVTGTRNDFIFPVAAPGCADWTRPARSGTDVAHRFDVPALTRLSIQLADTCSVIANLIAPSGCGTNGPSANSQGTTGLTCLAGSKPVWQCPNTPLVYDNTSSTPQTVYLVLEAGSPGFSVGYTFTARTSLVPRNDISTVSGPSVQGNPCLAAQRRSGKLKYVDTLSTTRNDFFVPTSTTCDVTTTDFGTVSSHPPSGPDTSIAYNVPAGHELRVDVQGWRPFQTPPYFTTRLVVGEAACGTNGADFADAGTQGLTCAASTQSQLGTNLQSLRYLNSSDASVEVFVVTDSLQAIAANTSFEVRATVVPPFDAGPPDAGPPDAGPPDAGPPDAGRPDAGPPDAGPPDAGPLDAGPPDAGASTCSTDSQCASNNCYCTGTPGSCSGLGRCVPGRTVISTTTDGVSVSGTFTVPAGCTQMHVSAWGAGGGQAQSFIPFPSQMAGGAGGYVSGLLSTAPGDVFTVWVGRGGANSSGIVGGEGAGSFFGTAANGGNVEIGATAGGGGGLTSIRQTGSATRSFTVPAGGGAGLTSGGQPAGGTGAGTASGVSGGDATPGTEGGGGGAGDKGGLGASSFQGAGAPGAFGTLPSGLSSSIGQIPIPMMLTAPAQTGTPNYLLCPSSTGYGNGGNGCVVLRCTTP